MSNNTKIRTMQGDLEEIKNKQAEQQKSLSEVAQKRTQQPSAQSNAAQPSALQAIRSDIRQQPAESAGIQDDKLKELIKKISAQTDKDFDDKYQAKDEKAEIVDDLAYKNRNNPIINKEESLKKIASDPVEKEVYNKNVDDIEKLKKLIHRISEPNPIAEEKSENKAGDLESVKEKNTAGSAANSLIRQPEKNIWQDLAGKKPIETKQVKTEKILALPAPQENKKSFWEGISGKIKKVSDSEKINALSGKNEISNIKTSADNRAEKYSSQSGILRSNEDKKQKENHQKEDLSKKAYYDENYMSPNERLIHGKQRFYSSVSKRIKLKEEKDELKSLEDATKMKKQEKIVTKEEEYKQLKQGIIQKYHIKIFSLPWKKIIPVALIALLLTGTVSYFIFSYIKPPAPPAPPALVVGSELEEFLSLEKKIIMTKNDLKGFNSLEVNALTIFNSGENVKIIKLLVTDNETDKNILPLREALDAIGIINIKEGINYLPEEFLQATTDNYNLFLFKTGKNSIRYGITIKINDEHFMSELMKKWGKEESKSRKMTTILKPLFIDSANQEYQWKSFESADYKEIKINYVHLIDSDTALNYFIHDNMLVITTSKDSTFTMVDLLKID